MQYIKDNITRTVRIYSDTSSFAYTRGNKDNYKVIYRKGYIQKAVYDYELLTLLKNLAQIYKPNYVYHNFVSVYNLVTSNAYRNKFRPNPDSYDFEQIIKITNNFKTQNNLLVNKTFDALYLEMIAEWYYKNTRLFHRLKRLGVYQVLFSGFSPKKAAHYSYGKNFTILNKQMKALGF